jgi:hypothetical protein
VPNCTGVLLLNIYLQIQKNAHGIDDDEDVLGEDNEAMQARQCLEIVDERAGTDEERERNSRRRIEEQAREMNENE